MKRNNKKREFRPYGWQLDPTSLCTKSNEVQYWRNGCMVTGQMLKSKAQELVVSGAAFVISEQNATELITKHAAGERIFSDADLRGAKLNWVAAQSAQWPSGQQIYSVYGIGTLRVVHYRPSTGTVWAGCWTGDFDGLEAELPRVIGECADPDRAKIEYDAMLAYFKALAIR